MSPDRPSVMFVGAHPDDIELCAGATVARMHEMGWRVIGVVLTGGERGGTHANLADVRREEARRAFAVLGAEGVLLNGTDTALDSSATRVIDDLVGIIRDTQPRAILTHPQNDSHPDHRTAATLVARAVFLAKLAEGEGKPHRIPHQFSFAPIPGERYLWRWKPDFLVDVTTTFARKLVALREHHSQREWLERYEEFATLEARRFGILAGVQMAEGFGSLAPLLLKTLPLTMDEGDHG